MAWETELVRIVRYLINDLEDTPTFSDGRLEETILVAAQLVMDEVDFQQEYTVDVDQWVLSPDPTLNTKDTAFINLVSLKAACLIDSGKLRTASASGGFLIKDGSSVIETKEHVKGFQWLVTNGPCKAYAEAKWEYQLGSLTPGRAILGPFSGPNVDTDYGDTIRDCR